MHTKKSTFALKIQTLANYMKLLDISIIFKNNNNKSQEISEYSLKKILII